MNLVPISGVDDLSVGDIIYHEGDCQTFMYRFEGMRGDGRVSLSYRRYREPETDWAIIGSGNSVEILRHMGRESPKFLPYSPKQQGDTDDDV